MWLSLSLPLHNGALPQLCFLLLHGGQHDQTSCVMCKTRSESSLWALYSLSAIILASEGDSPAAKKGTREIEISFLTLGAPAPFLCGWSHVG